MGSARRFFVAFFTVPVIWIPVDSCFIPILVEDCDYIERLQRFPHLIPFDSAIYREKNADVVQGIFIYLVSCTSHTR